MTISPEREWFSVREVAAVTGRARDVIANALRAGELRGYKPSEFGHWRVHRDDITAWMRGAVTEDAA